MDLPGDITKANREIALLNKLEVVITKVQLGDMSSLCDDIDKLTRDILRKADGETPPPNWVVGSAQQDIEDQINLIIDALQNEAVSMGRCP